MVHSWRAFRRQALRGCPADSDVTTWPGKSSCARFNLGAERYGTWPGTAGIARPRPVVLPPAASRAFLVEKFAQGCANHVGGLFGEEMTGGQRPAADVVGVLPPDTERLVPTANERLRPPQHQHWAFHSLPGGEGLFVVR